MSKTKRLALAMGAFLLPAAAFSAGASVGPGAARQQQPAGAVAAAPCPPAQAPAAAAMETRPQRVTITVPSQPGAEPTVEAEIAD